MLISHARININMFIRQCKAKLTYLSHVCVQKLPNLTDFYLKYQSIPLTLYLQVGVTQKTGPEESGCNIQNYQFLVMKNQNICLIANPVNILNNNCFCSSREKNVLQQSLYSIDIFKKIHSPKYILCIILNITNIYKPIGLQ